MQRVLQSDLQPRIPSAPRVDPLSPAERRNQRLALLDRCSILLSALVWTAVFVRLAPIYRDEVSGIALVLGAISGYVMADFFSGAVHWLADRYFDPDTPILGPALIAPFREHHRDALAMTRHDFFEVSGNNSLVVLPIAMALLLMPLPTGFVMKLFAASLTMLGLSIIATNQLHCWAHVSAPPRFVRRLQRWGLILSPERHALHHQPEHDASYCVTSGWLNPSLDRIRFFARLERAIEVLTRRPRRVS